MFHDVPMAVWQANIDLENSLQEQHHIVSSSLPIRSSSTRTHTLADLGRSTL
jgi:hypothetical protein